MGVIYDGVDTASLGLIARVTNFTILPEPKTLLIESDYMDGVHDLSSYNKDNRQYYNERLFDIELGLKGNSFKGKMDLVQKVAQWVSPGMAGYKELVIENTPDRVWMARPNARLTLDDITFFNGKVIVPFRCQPFAYGSVRTVNGSAPIGEADITLIGNVSVPLNLNFLIDSNVNPIRIQTGTAELQIRHESIPGSSFVEVEINSQKGYVKLDGKNKSNLSKGRYPILNPGDNLLKIYELTNTALFSYSPLYLI